MLILGESPKAKKCINKSQKDEHYTLHPVIIRPSPIGNNFLFVKFLKDISIFEGPLILMFWTSGDVCPGFQSQGGSLTWVLHHMHATDSPADLLVASMAAEPYWSMYFHIYKYWWGLSPESRVHCLAACDKTDALPIELCQYNFFCYREILWFNITISGNYVLNAKNLIVTCNFVHQWIKFMEVLYNIGVTSMCSVIKCKQSYFIDHYLYS